jgi:hypothetical protein
MRASSVFRLAFVLIILDYIFTITGIHLGIIEEANPIFEPIMGSPALSLAALFIVLAMLWIVRQASRRYKWVRAAGWLIIAERMAVMWLHARWVVAAIGL